MQEDLDLLLKRVAELERKIERYYQLLHINNELDFILNGTYVSQKEVENITLGEYQIGNSDSLSQTENQTQT